MYSPRSSVWAPCAICGQVYYWQGELASAILQGLGIQCNRCFENEVTPPEAEAQSGDTA